MKIEIGTKLKAKGNFTEEKEFGEVVLISNENSGDDSLTFIVVAHALHPKPSLLNLKTLKSKYKVIDEKDYLDDDARLNIDI